LHNTTYDRLEQHVAGEASDANDDLILGLLGRENANSLEVMNVLLGGARLKPSQRRPISSAPSWKTSSSPT
jgi:hypothetical protein